MLDPIELIDEPDIEFTHVSLLLSDLELLSSSGSEHLKDVELVDMSFADIITSEEGYVVQIDNIPAGAYDGIKFGIGVPADVNAKAPADFPSSSPLSNSGFYWHAWSSYIFMKVEGRIDTIAPQDFETGFAFHTGTNDLYRILESNFPISIDEAIAFDYAELLEGINIADNPQNHNPEDSLQIAKIVNNLQSAVTLFH
jgi:hypothetical protein